MLLQRHSASLLIENKLSNSIIGTCIASGHLNLFITFLQQSINTNLGKLYTTPTGDSTKQTIMESPLSTSLFSLPTLRGLFNTTQNQSAVEAKSSTKNANDIWIWKYADIKKGKPSQQYSLIYLIISRDWQGALSLILDELERFHLSYIQILEAAILNNKLNLVLRLLLRMKDKSLLHGKNSQHQNLFHLLANMNRYDENLFKQILFHIHEYHLDWNISDKYGSYPIHYACVKQNFIFINFLREKYSIEFNLNQLDIFENTAIGLLFWTTTETSVSHTQISSLITSSKQLDCLCNYDNEIAMNPLSFGYTNSSIEKISYPPMKSDNASTNVRTSPLINAIVLNNFSLVKFLLQNNADVNYPDEEKRTPLMHAVRQVKEIKTSIHLLSDFIYRITSILSNYF
jgi:ankyrin repeat protein